MNSRSFSGSVVARRRLCSHNDMMYKLFIFVSYEIMQVYTLRIQMRIIYILGI